MKSFTVLIVLMFGVGAVLGEMCTWYPTLSYSTSQYCVWGCCYTYSYPCCEASMVEDNLLPVPNLPQDVGEWELADAIDKSERQSSARTAGPDSHPSFKLIKRIPGYSGTPFIVGMSVSGGIVVLAVIVAVCVRQRRRVVTSVQYSSPGTQNIFSTSTSTSVTSGYSNPGFVRTY